MQASFDEKGNLTGRGKDAQPATAEGLGGKNISGVNDPKAQIDADKVGRDAGTDASSEPITTGRAPVGYDADTGELGTLEHPGRGNVKNAAGKTTTAGNPKAAIPGQRGT